MLHICTWHWGKKYGPSYVEKLAAGVGRNLHQDYRFCVFTPCEADDYLTKIKGCFARLRMFDPEWQKLNGIKPNDRMVCVDLDVVVTGELDALFCRPEQFLILQGANAANPCPYNGSLWMLRAGYRPDVWSDFSLGAAHNIPFYEFPDDQGWLAHKLPGEPGWEAGSRSGVYAFKKPGWPDGDDLPKDARIVVFPGWRDPARFKHLPWIKKHWK